MFKKVLSMLITIGFMVTLAAPAMAEEWNPLPLVTHKQLDHGVTGGEGCQWPLFITSDSKKGDFLLMGTDVGGLYRSDDGGKNWAQALIGINSRGACAAAIDPNNINRAILVGANSVTSDDNGVYLSTDKAQTWKNVFKADLRGYRDIREQLAFDKNSYDDTIKGSAVAYWSRSDGTDFGYGATPTNHPALYKSLDGGASWSEIANTAAIGLSNIKVNPTNHNVYAANKTGFYKSIDGGTTFTKIMSGNITGMDIAYDKVYLTRDDRTDYSNSDNRIKDTAEHGVFVSSDCGTSFKKVQSSNFAALLVPMKIKVSPIDPNSIIVTEETVNLGSPDYNADGPYYSKDAGVTWTRSIIDKTNSFIAFNARNYAFAWDPDEKDVVWTFGGDWISKSGDGGVNFKWSNNGNNGIMPGGSFNFNFADPNLLYIVSQDYNGGLTKDGGITWDYINHSDWEWGGWGYGAYAVNPKLLVVSAKHWDNKQRIFISRDGGTTFTHIDLGKNSSGGEITLGGLGTTYADPTDDHYIFIHDYFSPDQGYTWYKMNGCNGVLTSDPKTGTLYGALDNKIVTSTDHGYTWTPLTEVVGNINDIAIDNKNNSVYAVTMDKMFNYDITSQKVTEITSLTPVDQKGARHLSTVAIDPVDNNVVYAGGSGNVYATDTAVIRSIDAGKTWQTITRNTRDSVITTGYDGGLEANWIRVNPLTREAYVGGQCYGMWKIGAPGSANPVKAAPLKIIPGNNQVTLNWFGNGRTGLSDLVEQAAAISINPTTSDKDEYDLNGDRVVDEKDLSITLNNIFSDNNKPLDIYEVYRSCSKEGKYLSVSSPITDTSFMDYFAKNGTTYYYKVKCLATGKETVVASTEPTNSAPNAIYATENTDNVELMWESKSGTYNVFRSDSPTGKFTKIATGLKEEYFKDATVVKDKKYYYQVSINSKCGESKKSEIKIASTKITAKAPLVDGL